MHDAFVSFDKAIVELLHDVMKDLVLVKEAR